MYDPNIVPSNPEDIQRFLQDELSKLRYEIDRIDYEFITPDSITVNTGGAPVGTVDDVQEFHDGNVYQLPEVTGAPGFDVDFNFKNVMDIYGIVSRIRYAGSATHQVDLNLYDYVASGLKQFILIPNTGANYQYRTILIPSYRQFINQDAEAIINLYHLTSGNASHDLYVDYIALMGKRNTKY
jgi:hypothetical protein